MIVTDKFVFVHFPRTGGTFVTDMVMKFFPSAREIGYHLPISLLPKEYSHLPVLGQSAIPGNFMYPGITTSGREISENRYSHGSQTLQGAI